MGWDKILDLAAQYGPFPVGIVVGMWIKQWGTKLYFQSTEKEKEHLRSQIKDLHDVVKSKDDRISKLHNDLHQLSTGRKS